jgi:hypothetical protein
VVLTILIVCAPDWRCTSDQSVFRSSDGGPGAADRSTSGTIPQGDGTTVRCPKCHFDHPLQTTECLKCGIVFSKYKPPVDPSGISGVAAKRPEAAVPAKPTDARMAAAVVSSFAASLDTALSPDAHKSPAAIRKGAATEFKCRLLALPLALLWGYWATGTGLDMPAGMLAMVVHESGHAITAWLAGRWAVPLLWVTMHGESRSWPIVVMVMSAIVFCGFLAWRARRWELACAAGAVLVLQLVILSTLSDFQQQGLIVFGGDGGALVLATILMSTFYAPRASALPKSRGLRWGLLVIGALIFMHVFRAWSGPLENIPFGEIEGVNLSDPSLLTQLYGWSVLQMVDRYLLLAKACFLGMGALYLWGLAWAYVDLRYPAPQGRHKEFEIQASR